MSFTPMIRQYLDVKKQNPDAILFFRLGDFYEMFFEDAVLASRELEITLTGRDGGASEKVPMCGVPYHAVEGYIARLIAKGYRVAICEQVEDPAEAKGIVRREVTRVITPGTVIDGQLLEDKTNHFLCSVATGQEAFGLAVTDITTGLFMVAGFAGKSGRDELIEEMVRLKPAEIIMPASLINSSLFHRFKEVCQAPVSGYFDHAYLAEAAVPAVQEWFGEDILKDSDLVAFAAVWGAAGALLSFLKDTQKRELTHINRLRIYHPERYMFLDTTTRRNLELTVSLREGSRRGTLLAVLDRSVTAMGGRILRSWLLQPLLDRNRIEARLDAVQELAEGVFLRSDLRDYLKCIYDLERLAGRISFGSANARDLLALGKSLSCLPGIKEKLSETVSTLLKDLGVQLDILEDVKDFLDRAVADDPPLSLRDAGIIRPGYHPDVDRLRTAGRDGKALLAGLEERERSRTGIRSLKVGYNKVFGYFIEVTRANLNQVPPEYTRRQTLANAERYITPELKEYEEMILGAEDRLAQLEYRLFLEIREFLLDNLPRIQRTAAALGQIDALRSLSEAAVEGGYCRPSLNNNLCIRISEGRHPVLEQVLGPGCFVPNDLDLDGGERRLILLTGPNMAGKSTYMRQVALIVLMAQTGSFVPAREAEIGLVDRIFTRVGAADDLAGGLSTFMVEMKECREIVQGATEKSLIIMDEVGRGTSTYDGISIARALAEYINGRIGARTIFSTHFHELTDLEEINGVVNHTVAVKEEGEGIIFLRKVVPGKADRSYGIHVARLAGLPEEILSRSRDLLSCLEAAKGPRAEAAAAGERGCDHATCTTDAAGEHPVLQDLRGINIMDITPMEAINRLYQLQKRLNSCIL